MLGISQNRKWCTPLIGQLIFRQPNSRYLDQRSSTCAAMLIIPGEVVCDVRRNNELPQQGIRQFPRLLLIRQVTRSKPRFCRETCSRRSRAPRSAHSSPATCLLSKRGDYCMTRAPVSPGYALYKPTAVGRGERLTPLVLDAPVSRRFGDT